MVPGEFSAEFFLADFNFYPVGLNQNTPHHFSDEFLHGGGGSRAQLFGLLHGRCYKLLSSCRKISRQAELIHDLLGGMQEGLQPERNLLFNIIGRQSRRFARCPTSVNRRLANVVAIPFAVLQCVGRGESIALSILQQTNQQA